MVKVDVLMHATACSRSGHEVIRFEKAKGSMVLEPSFRDGMKFWTWEVDQSRMGMSGMAWIGAGRLDV